MTIVPIGSLKIQVSEKKQASNFQEFNRVLQKQVRYVVGRCIEEALETEVERWLGRKSHIRRRRIKKQAISIRCSRCYSHQRKDFRRNGHYQRYLNTRWGLVLINVPQVCCVCGGNVRTSFQTIRSGQRLWDDVEIELQVQYSQGISYRQIQEDWERRTGDRFGLCTLNRNVLTSVASDLPSPQWNRSQVPPVVRLDGIWITVMFATGQTQKDRLGRVRMVKKAKKVPILAAQGVWPVTGETRLLTWSRANGEDTDSWQSFLEQLYEAGLTPANGLELLVCDGGTGLLAAYENVYWMVPLQRCIFHKLRNIARAIDTPADLNRQEAHQYRISFLHQAATIWKADDETEARRLCQAFCRQWQSVQPKAIATLLRDFERTLTFYVVQDKAVVQNQNWPAHLLRTTSQLERRFREFRRRYRNAVLFYSEAGADAVTSSLASRFS